MLYNSVPVKDPLKLNSLRGAKTTFKHLKGTTSNSNLFTWDFPHRGQDNFVYLTTLVSLSILELKYTWLLMHIMLYRATL